MSFDLKDLPDLEYSLLRSQHRTFLSICSKSSEPVACQPDVLRFSDLVLLCAAALSIDKGGSEKCV